MKPVCADCGRSVGSRGPVDGWQLEDGRTVCHLCCVEDTRRLTFCQSPNLRIVRAQPVQPRETLGQWLALIALSLAIGAMFAL
jgi:hypothetical protein